MSNTNYMPEFKSIFNTELQDFIIYKRNHGFEYNTRTCDKFKMIDKFFISINLKEKKIDNTIIEKWQAIHYNCSETTKYSSYSNLRMFSKFLKSANYKNIATLEKNPYHYERYIPYIYTKDELKSIFKKSESNTDLFVALHLLYNCGLRISEVSNLKVKNLNYHNKTLLIEKSKFSKTRLIPLGNDIFDLLSQYILSQNISEDMYIFYNDKTRLNTNNYYIRIPFHKIQKELGMPIRYNNCLPRIHDLRHTFAIHALEQMQNKGFDLYTSLPILSVYMGHASILETEYYLRLTSEFSNKVLTSNEYIKDLYTLKEDCYEK